MGVTRISWAGAVDRSVLPLGQARSSGVDIVVGSVLVSNRSWLVVGLDFFSFWQAHQSRSLPIALVATLPPPRSPYDTCTPCSTTAFCADDNISQVTEVVFESDIYRGSYGKGSPGRHLRTAASTTSEAAQAHEVRS